MPIEVLCTGCKTRFQVSDKFAGQKGPCPKCKAIIQVPAKTEQVVVHAPEQFGPKDSQGRAVLKPITRVETVVTPLRIGLVVGTILTIFIFAIYLRFSVENKAEFPWWPLIAGALLIAPLTGWSGYAFLRDDELEPYRGTSMAIRVALCSAAYATLWAIYYGIKLSFLDNKPPETFELVLIIPTLLATGALAAWGCFDLTYSTGLVHVGFYLFISVILRKVVGLPIL